MPLPKIRPLATSPPTPKSATLRKNLSISGPALLRKVTRPTSMGVDGAWVITLRASFSPGGMFRRLVRSQPVPEGPIPSVVSGLMICRLSKKPLAISFIVPSPPTPLISSCPDLIASRVISMAWSGFSVNSYRNSWMKLRMASLISFQRRRVRPWLDSGLTMTWVLMRLIRGSLGRRDFFPAEHRGADQPAQGAEGRVDNGRGEEAEKEPGGRHPA